MAQDFEHLFQKYMKPENPNDTHTEENKAQQPNAENCTPENETTAQERHAPIKNAHATGMGAIGRSEEKIEDATKPDGKGKKNVY